MGKYQLNKEYRFLSHFRPKPTRFMLWLGRALLSGGFSFTTHKCNVKKIKKDSFKLYIYTPKKSAETKRCIFMVPGGGFFIKPGPYHFWLAQDYSLMANCKVIMVDYRLSPKYKFPTAIDDVERAYKYVLENANTIGIDVNNIIMVGDSAGGALAQSLNFKLRDEEEQMPIACMLIYPVADNREITESMKKYCDTPIWNGKNNHMMWESYLGDYIPENDGYSVPCLAKDFSKMPDTYIELAEFDCLHDEGYGMYTRLKEAGNNVSVRQIDGTMHGFEFIYWGNTIKRVLKMRSDYFNEMFNK